MGAGRRVGHARHLTNMACPACEGRNRNDRTSEKLPTCLPTPSTDGASDSVPKLLTFLRPVGTVGRHSRDGLGALSIRVVGYILHDAPRRHALERPATAATQARPAEHVWSMRKNGKQVDGGYADTGSGDGSTSSSTTANSPTVRRWVTRADALAESPRSGGNFRQKAGSR
jgi:hypothetical protein